MGQKMSVKTFVFVLCKAMTLFMRLVVSDLKVKTVFLTLFIGKQQIMKKSNER